MTKVTMIVLVGLAAFTLVLGGCSNSEEKIRILNEQLSEANEDLSNTQEELGEVDADWRSLINELAASNRARAAEKKRFQTTLRDIQKVSAKRLAEVNRKLRRAEAVKKGAERQFKKFFELQQKFIQDAKAMEARLNKQIADLKLEIKQLEAKLPPEPDVNARAAE